MNTIGNFIEKPQAYHIGKSHEVWALDLINTNPTSGIVSTWLKNTPYEQVSSIVPESHTEKSDFFISTKTRQKNGMTKVFVEGVSAKCGTTDMPGQLFRGSLNSVKQMNFIPSNGIVYEQHIEWLSKRKEMISISNLDTAKWLEWYQDNWDYIKESTLFGNKTSASTILMSNLDYKNQELKVTETVLISKKQVLEDLQTLSNYKQVSINLNNRGAIVSGIISIQRAGGSNGEKGAEDWQARINRSTYIKWVKANRPDTVWVG